MSVTSAVSARTIITVLTNDTTTSETTTLTIGLSSGTALTQSFTTNIVYYSANLLSMSSVKLEFTSIAGKRLCTPELFVIDQHKLWQISGRTSSVNGDQTDTSSNTQLSSFTAFKPVTDTNSWIYESAACYQFSQTNINHLWSVYINFNGDTGPSNQLVLLTHFVIIYGQSDTSSSNYFYQAATPTYDSTYTTYTSVLPTTFSSITKNSAVTVSDSNGATGQITNKLRIYIKGIATINICAIIPLGYPCCFIDSIDDKTTSTTSFVINAANPSTATTKQYQAGFYIDTAKTLTNDLFCSFGLTATIKCSDCTTDPTFTTSIATTGLVTFTISTTDVANYGTKTLSLTFTDSRNTEQTSGLTKAFSFSFTCCTATLTVTIPSSSVSYAIKGASASQTITTTESTSCGFPVVCSLDSDKPSWVTNDGCKISWYATDTSLTLKDYNVPITITYKNCSTTQISKSFTITLTGCVGSFSYNTPSDQYYTVNNPSASLTLTATDSSTCGYTYNCTLGTGAPDWVAVTTACVVSWSTSKTSLTAGAYSVPILVTFNTAVAQTDSSKTITFKINLSTCVDSFTESTPTTPQDYVIKSGVTGSYTFTVASQNNCGYTKSCDYDTSSDKPDWVNLSSCTLTWSATDISLTPTTYNIVIKVTQNYQPSSITYKKTLSINLIACQKDLEISAPVDVSYNIKDPKASQTITATDKSNCGYTPTCSFDSDSTQPSWTDVNSCVYGWYIDSTSIATGVQTVTTKVSFNTVPATVTKQDFKITVSYCVGTFSVSTPSNKAYTIKAADSSQTITATETTSCGYSATCSKGDSFPTVIADLNGCVVSWSSTDITLSAGSYDVPVKVEFNDNLKTSYTKTFTITLSTCPLTSTISTPDTQTYTIKQATAGSTSIIATDSSSSPNCGYTATCAKGSSAPTWVIVNSCSDITWAPTDLTLAANSYSVPVDVTFNTVPTTTTTKTFSITLSTCALVQDISVISDQTYTVKDTAGSQTITATDTSGCGYTASCRLDSSKPTWGVSISGCVISWQSDDTSLSTSSPYTVPITISYNTVPATTVQKSFQITVTQCAISATYGTLNNQVYALKDAKGTQTISATDSSSCGYTATCTLTTNATVTALVSISGCVVSWESTSTALTLGNYVVIVTTKFSNSAATTKDLEFTIAVTACASNLQVTQPSDQTHTVKGTSGSLTLSASDTSSCGYTTTCQLTSTDTWVQMSGLVISWSATDLTLTPKSYTVSVSCALNDGTATSTTTSFSIVLSQCSGTFSYPTPSSQSYTIGDSQGSLSVPASDTSSCGYTPTYALGSSKPDWADISGSTVTWRITAVTVSPGTYSIPITASFPTLPTTTTQDTTLTIVVSACAGTFTYTPTLVSKTYAIGSTAASQTVSASESSSCGYTPTCTLGSANPTWGITISSCVVTWETKQLNLATIDYTVPVTVSWNTLPTATTHDTSFVITLTQCQGTFTATTPSTQTYAVTAARTSLTISAADTSGCGYSYSCNPDSSNPDWVTMSGCVLSWQTSNTTLTSGNYPVKYTVTFNDSAATVKTISFNIALTLCLCNPSVVDLTSVTYRIGDPQASQVISASDSNSCGYTVQYSLEDQKPDWISISGNTINWQTSNISLTTGSYSIQVIVTWLANPNSVYQIKTLSISLLACTETYSLTTPTDQSYTIWGAKGSQAIQASDLSTCGYSSTCSLGSQAPDWVKISGCTVSWYTETNSVATTSIYTVPLEIKMATTTHTSSFQINVSPCVPIFTITTPSNVSYWIADPAANTTISTTTTQSCGYTPLCSLITRPTWLTATNCYLQWQTNNYSLTTPTNWQISIKLTYLDYTQTYYDIGSTSFYIALSKDLTKCLSATLTSNSQSQVSLTNQVALKIILQVSDSVSQSIATNNYCGEYSVSLSGINPTWLAINLTDFNLTLTQKQLFSQEKSAKIELFYQLVYFPTVNLTQSMNIVAQYCKVSSLVPSNTALTLSYTIGSGKKVYSLPSYTMVPACPGYQYVLSFTQVRGTTLSETACTIIGTNLNLKLDDNSYANTTIILSLTALLSNSEGTSNSEVLVSIQMLAKTSSESSSQNQTEKSGNVLAALNPIFSGILLSSSSLPCVSSLEAKTWRYEFPMVISNGQSVDYSFSCPGLDNILISDYSTGVFVLSLTPSQINQPYPGFYRATMKLSYTGGSPMIYHTSFQVSCPASFARGVFIPRPYPKIQKVDASGLLTIKWNDTMSAQTDSKLIQNAKITLEDKVVPSLAVSIVQGSQFEDPSVQNYTYNITSIDTQYITIQIQWSNPAFVSASINSQDQVCVTFNDPNYFVSEKTGMTVQQGLKILGNIPRQNAPGQVQIDATGAKFATQAAMLFSMAMPIVLQAVLNQLLSAIRSMTIIVHMFTITLMYPPNCLKFFNMIFPIVSFQLLPTTAIFDKIFQFQNLVNDNPLTDQFNAVGYGNLMFIENMGTLFLALFIAPMLWTVQVLIFKLSHYIAKIPKIGAKINKQAQDSVNGIFWNTPISFMFESYIVISICALIQLRHMNLNPETTLWSEVFSGYCAIFAIVTVILFPAVIGYIYWKNLKSVKPPPNPEDMELDQIFDQYGTLDFKKIQKENFTQQHLTEFNNRYGVLTHDLFTTKIGVSTAIVTPIVIILRSLLAALSVCMFTKQGSLVVFSFMITSIFVLAFEFTFLPRAEKVEQLRGVVNEITVLFVTYHFICFTDYVPVLAQNSVGNALIYVTCANALFNISLTSLDPLNHLKLLWKRKKFRRDQINKRKVESEKKPDEDEILYEIPIEPPRERKGRKEIIQSVPEIKMMPVYGQNNDSFSQNNLPDLESLSPMRDNSKTSNMYDSTELVYPPPSDLIQGRFPPNQIPNFEPLPNSTPSEQLDQMLNYLHATTQPKKIPKSKSKSKLNVSKGITYSLGSISEVEEENQLE